LNFLKYEPFSNTNTIFCEHFSNMNISKNCYFELFKNELFYSNFEILKYEYYMDFWNCSSWKTIKHKKNDIEKSDPWRVVITKSDGEEHRTTNYRLDRVRRRRAGGVRMRTLCLMCQLGIPWCIYSQKILALADARPHCNGRSTPTLVHLLAKDFSSGRC
jgi:hypothetical protein